MSWRDWLIPGSCIILELAIVLLFVKRSLWRGFPAFAGHITFALLQATAFAVTVSRAPTYFLVFWATTPVEILLTILATLESFWRVLGSFRLLSWFRLVLPLAILAALAYGAVQGYRVHPVEAGPVEAAIISATVASHYVIVAIALLFFVLVALFHVPWRRHEHRFVLGFGVASLAVAFGGSVRAVFGSHFEWVSQQAQPIGYLVALLVWFSAAVYPATEARADLDSPVENVNGLKFQLRNLRSFVRKGARYSEDDSQKRNGTKRIHLKVPR